MAIIMLYILVLSSYTNAKYRLFDHQTNDTLHAEIMVSNLNGGM